MNVRIVAALLFADKELEELERVMKRKHDWRNVHRIARVKAHLVHAMEREQEGLQALYVEYQDESTADHALRP